MSNVDAAYEVAERGIAFFFKGTRRSLKERNVRASVPYLCYSDDLGAGFGWTVSVTQHCGAMEEMAVCINCPQGHPLSLVGTMLYGQG